MKIKNKFIESINKNWWLYAFILGVLLYYMYMSVTEMAFGRYLFIRGDALDSYIPISKDLARTILSGDTPFYSWNYGMGKNNSAVVASYGQVCGISNILFLIFNNFDPAIPAFIALLIKAGLTAMCFQIYSVRYLNDNKILCLLMSLCYSLCSYQIYFNNINYFFMDAMWILPLVIYFIRRYLEDGNWVPLTLCYTYIFVNSLYMAYMIGIFSFMYYLCFLIKKKPEKKYVIKSLAKYSLSVLISIGIFSFLLFPALYFVLNNSINEGEVIIPRSITLLDIYNQLFIGENNSTRSFFPYIYTGLLTCLMLPLYCINKKINIKDKIIHLSLLGVLIISCFINGLYIFWHAFNFPDSWGHRFAFIISFLLCTMACEELKYIEEIKEKALFIIILVNVGIFVFEMFYQRKYSENFQSNDIKNLVINVIFMILCLIMIFAYKRLHANIKYQKLISLVMVLFVSFELILNGYLSIDDVKNYLNVRTDKYYHWEEVTKKSVNEIESKENNNDFYRVNSQGDFVCCTDTLFGFNGNSDFDSAGNYTLRSTLRKHGIYTSTRLMLPFGYTDFTNMLMGIKYNLVHHDYNSYPNYLEYENKVYDVDSYIGLGFLVDDGVKEYSAISDSPYENLNNLSKKMTGLDFDLYEKINDDNIKLNYENIEMSENNGEKTINLTSLEGKNGHINISVPKDDREAYITFSFGDTSAYVVSAPYINLGIENIAEQYGRITTKYIKPMIEKDDLYDVDVYMAYDEKQMSYIWPDIYAAYYNKDNFDKVYDNLKQNPMKVVDYHNGYVHATATATSDRKLLFTSIPYEEGWKVYVNGNEKEITKLIDGTFIGVELDEGENELIFEFTTPYAKLGRNITFVSIIVFAIAVFIRKKNNKKSSVENS